MIELSSGAVVMSSQARRDRALWLMVGSDFVLRVIHDTTDVMKTYGAFPLMLDDIVFEYRHD